MPLRDSLEAPSISVLVPTYNDGFMLAEALRSLQAQSFGDFEVVVSDDASSAGIVDDVSAIISSDRRFRYFRQRHNLGMTRNWNAMLPLARGKFVMKLDADDEYRPETLAHLFDAACRHQAEIAFCRTEYCDSAMQPIGEYRGETFLRSQGIDPALERALPSSVWYPLCFYDCQLWHSNAFLLSRRLLIRLGGWDEQWGCASDTDLILRLMETGLDAVHCPYVGVRYRLRDGSVSTLYRRANWLSKETAAIHLLSLRRMDKTGMTMDRHLRRRWYWYWLLWLRVNPPPNTSYGELPYVFTLPPPVPPLRVRLEGFFIEEMTRPLRFIKRLFLRLLKPC